MSQRFEELKKNILKALISAQERLEENSSYNFLKEKYQTLSLFKQRLVKYGVFVALAGIILFLPISYFTSSLFYEKEFKEKKSLALKLLRIRTNPVPPFPQISQDEMKKRISDVIIKYQKQNYTINNEFSSQDRNSKLKKISFKIQVSHLNVRHAIQLGEGLTKLPLFKVKSIQMQENEKYEKHYDVTYVVSFFTIPSSVKEKLKVESKVKSQRKKFNKDKDWEKKKDKDKEKKK